MRPAVLRWAWASMAVRGWFSTPGSPDLDVFDSLTTATSYRPVSLKSKVATVPAQSWPWAVITLRQVPHFFQ